MNNAYAEIEWLQLQLKALNALNRAGCAGRRKACSSYDEESREVEVAGRSGPGNEDLLNLLAAKALAQGGAVIALPQDLVSRTGPVAGLFRY